MSLFDYNSPLIHIKELKKPVSFQIGNEFKTIFKFNSKYYMAEDRCQHRGMKLCHSKTYDNNSMTCPYHGKSNSVKQELYVFGNYLWTTDPRNFFSEVPDHFIFSGSLDVLLDAPFHVVVDNFNEGSHTPYVHRFLGPESSDLSEVSFSWERLEDFIHIKYKTNQKKNFIFYGFKKNRTIDWVIDWKTYVKPMHMRYYSEWIDRKTQEKVIEKNMTFFFLTPVGQNKTRIHAFVYIQPMTWMKYFPYLVKKASLFMTKNQILEDQWFYPKIADLPNSLDQLKLDQYDQPLTAIRERAEAFYSGFIAK